MSESSALQDRRTAAVPRGVATKTLFAARAENAELWDVDGKRYIDFAAGIAVVNTGHRHPKVMAAVETQLKAFTHTSFNVAPYEGYIRLAERLNRLAPGAFAKKTLFLTTGVEAVENAVKIARYATGRPAIIAFASGFHGRTLMGLALTGKVMPYKKGFGPFPPEIYHAPFPNPYRGVSTADAFAGLERLFQADVAPEQVAALIVEPVQGEGGFHVAPPEFLRALRALCDKHGIVYISDEIQAGMARTGKMFGIEHAGVVPDLMTLAKGLGGGLPLSAVTGRAELMDTAHPGGLGGTYAGNPLAIAAGNAVLDVIEEERLCERASELGRHMLQHLEAMAKRNLFACMGDVRGLGAMTAFELVKNRMTKEPDPDLTSALLAKAQEKGLILLSCGAWGNVVRLLPPLTAPTELVGEGLQLVEQSLGELVAS